MKTHRFKIDAAAFVQTRSHFGMDLWPSKWPFRAVVHFGGQMQWQWCQTRKEALAWIETFKKPVNL